MTTTSAPAIIRTGRGPVEYVDTGEGPAVLALHGAMGGHDQSLLLARTIAEPRYRYLALSRPGYLGTPLAAGAAPEEQADLYAEVLDKLGVARAGVMAVSGGGPSAIQFALRHPDRCWGLVLVSTCADKIKTPFPLAFLLVKLLANWPGFAASKIQSLERDPDTAAKPSIPDPAVRARTLADPDAGPLLLELLRSTLDRMAQRIDGTQNDIAVSRSTAYPLERIAVPVLVVHGTGDRIVPFAQHAQPLALRIPGAELLAIEGGEHVSIFTHRDLVRERVTAFLREHAARSLSHAGS